MKPWDNIELTDEEREQALIEAKKRRYFHEKNIDFWLAESMKAIEREEEDKRQRRLKRKKTDTV